jgi:hypothetical protein
MRRCPKHHWQGTEHPRRPAGFVVGAVVVLEIMLVLEAGR